MHTFGCQNRPKKWNKNKSHFKYLIEFDYDFKFKTPLRFDRLSISHFNRLSFSNIQTALN